MFLVPLIMFGCGISYLKNYCDNYLDERSKIIKIDDRVLLDSERLHHIVDSLSRRQNEIFGTKSFFLTEIADNRTRNGVATAYSNLAKISANSFEIIKNLSYSMQAQYNDDAAKLLVTVIDENSNYTITGHAKDEIPWLDSIINNSSDKQTIARAKYRLSMIYLFGLSSSLDGENFNLDLINLDLANKLQMEIIKDLDIKQSKVTDIQFAVNEKYANHLYVTITSILLHTDLDNRCNFIVVMDEENPILKKTQKKIINSLKNLKECDLSFINFPDNIIKNNTKIFNTKIFKAFPRLVMFKILSNYLFPNLDSIIVLDADILVQRDLYELQHQNLEGSVIAAAMDPLATMFKYKASYKNHDVCKSLPIHPFYINSGVIVWNLKALNKINNAKILSDAIVDPRCFACPEQDLINIAYINKIKNISTSWNFLPTFPKIKNSGTGHVQNNYYNRNFMPFIIHYMGPKPWEKFEDNRYTQLWWLYQNFCYSLK